MSFSVGLYFGAAGAAPAIVLLSLVDKKCNVDVCMCPLVQGGPENND